MKKIISLLLATCGLFITNTVLAEAYYVQPSPSYQYTYDNNNYNNSYTPYYNNYINAPTSNSYTYTQGCTMYQYDAYTRITSIIGSICTTASVAPSYNTYPSYQNYYTQPTYAHRYVQPTYSYSYVAPITQYQTYQYSNQDNGWYSGNTTNTGCYWYNGYQVCY